MEKPDIPDEILREAVITVAEGFLERVVQRDLTHVEKGLHGGPVPAHLLFHVHTLGPDLFDPALDECCRDRLTPPTSSAAPAYPGYTRGSQEAR
jgi:hypothetical protein